jgi:hypothetical protein
MYSCTLHIEYFHSYESTKVHTRALHTVHVPSYIFMKVSYITVVLYVVHVYGSTEVLS